VEGLGFYAEMAGNLLCEFWQKGFHGMHSYGEGALFFSPKSCQLRRV
jgi:hypothetical protein